MGNRISGAIRQRIRDNMQNNSDQRWHSSNDYQSLGNESRDHSTEDQEDDIGTPALDQKVNQINQRYYYQ